MNQFFHTNVEIYKMIADEAYQKMVQSIEAGRRPKPDGSAGWIITYDPEHTSFKQAVISIVFTGIWLEAMLHLLFVKTKGKNDFKEYDRKWYEEKLRLLGCTDEELISAVANFRKARNTLVHEKAHFDDKEVRFAQKEAEKAHAILAAISEFFSGQSGQPVVSPDGFATR